MYTIGQLAKRVGVTVEAVRYYERQKLIDQPEKPNRGYRRYPETSLLRLLFIKRAQGLGFTLAEIASLIEMSAGPCSNIKDIAENKLVIVREKIKALQDLERTLKSLVDECAANPDEAECPVITTLVKASR